MALTQIKADALTADLIDETKIADNGIDSEHYNDGSIDHAHLANDAVDGDNIADDSIGAEHIADNAVGLAALASGTDGQIISWDASGNPVAIGPGTDGQVLTSTGAGSPPAFEAVPAGGISDIVSDTTPQLGGNLDVNGNDITGDAIDFHAADGQVIAKLHKTNSSEFYFNNSKKLEVTNTGISVTGSLTASGGVYVGGTGGSNYLDDYEEGTFTPYFHLGSSPGAVTSGGSYAQQDGRYTKVGRFVSATFAVQGAHPASSFDNWSSGDGFIKGWPFAFQGSQPQQVAFCRIHGTSGSWGTTYAPYVIYENYSDKVHLQGYNSGGVEPPGNVGNSFGYWGSLQYHAS